MPKFYWFVTVSFPVTPGKAAPFPMTQAKTAGGIDLPGSPDESARFRLNMYSCPISRCVHW
jgi:hypothetical protein